MSKSIPLPQTITKPDITRKMANQAAILAQTHGPLVIKDVPVPRCQPTEVLVKVRAVATNAADWKVYEGHFPQVLPTLLGCDVAGEISEIGESVTGLNVGDRVCCSILSHVKINPNRSTGCWLYPAAIGWNAIHDGYRLCCL